MGTSSRGIIYYRCLYNFIMNNCWNLESFINIYKQSVNENSTTFLKIPYY